MSALFSAVGNDQKVSRVRALRHFVVTGEQPFLFGDSAWIQIRDGNPTAMAIFARHYTARKRRRIFQFVGPGEQIVLLSPDALALFVWRKFISDSGEAGVNCAVFRNEGSASGKSSELIEAAKSIAWRRWPGERLYTYVDPLAVRHKRDPGRCFLKAGFKRCGLTKDGKLILDCQPQSANAGEPVIVADPPAKNLARTHVIEDIQLQDPGRQRPDRDGQRDAG